MKIIAILAFAFLSFNFAKAEAAEDCRALAKSHARAHGASSVTYTGKVSFDLTHYFGYAFVKAGRTCSFAVAGRVTGSWWAGELECWLPGGNGNLSCE